VIGSLKTPPTRERLKELIASMGIPVRALLREKGTPYAELGLGEPKWTDNELIDFMMEHPILIEAEPSKHVLRQPVATAPGEGKGVAQDRTDVFFHFTLQECASAVQTRLHRLG